MSTSRFLSPRAVIGLERVGDRLMPRDGRFPSFSELGVIVHVDGVAEHIPDDDRGALNILLAVLSWLPTPLLDGFLWLVAAGVKWPNPAGTIFRMLDVALRSVVVTLYFSGKRGPNYAGETPQEIIGYHVNAVR